jgi:hypothetical protein
VDATIHAGTGARKRVADEAMAALVLQPKQFFTGAHSPAGRRNWTKSLRDQSADTGFRCGAFSCPSLGSSRRRPEASRRPPEVNQDSPDPEGRGNQLNSSNLHPSTRARGTRCWSLLGFMLDFAVLYSLRCRTLQSS